MKKAKQVHRKKIIFRCISGAIFYLLFTIGVFGHQNISKASAAILRIKNHVTNETTNYTGTQVLYKINDEIIQTDYPGIIRPNGAAVGSYHEIFEAKLGTTSDYTEGKNDFTITYGPYSIQMTLGKTEALVNGKKQTMPNAPYLYSFQNKSETYLYVPTRFVAETFGFTYSWDSVAATASISRQNIIYDGKDKITYTGITPTFSINGCVVSSNRFPGYILEDVAFFEAEDYFKNSGMASYAYAEGSGLILLKKGEVLVRLVLDSPIAYINDTSYLLDAVPRLITPQNSSEARVYLPAKFVAEALGYRVLYQEATGNFEVTGSLPAKDNQDAPPSDVSGTVIPDTASYGKILFSHETNEQIIAHFKEQGYHVPAAISAYSCLNSDALYLKGIDFNNIRITDKTDVIEIEVAMCRNPFDRTAYYDTRNSYINYCYIAGSECLKIFIFKTKELSYYAYPAPDGCVVHFTDALTEARDNLKFIGVSEPSKDSDDTEIFSESEISQPLPEAVFSRNHFVIRFPKNIAPNSLVDVDEYDKNRFTISIPGNHMSFLAEQKAYNPVKSLKNFQINYNVSNNTTVITFNTTKIQGYAITVNGGYLAIKIADPTEIYDKIVVLDAGHGGIDPGTSRGNVYEKNINFNVVNQYAKEYFSNSDIKIYYTRTTDTKIALQTRADFAALVGADLFISFHVNAHSNSAVNGTSVYYSASNNQPNSSGLKSSVLANTLVNYLSKAWGTKNRGIISEKFVVVHNNSVPAVLVECGFITNDVDFAKIKDSSYQKKAAKAIFDAVNEIFEQYPTRR